MSRRLGVLLHLLLAAAAPLRLIPSTDPDIQWIGRRVPFADGSMLIDWEGSSLSFSTSPNTTYVGLRLNDTTPGGARLAVFVTLAGALPGSLRVATLVTSSYQSLYTLAAGSSLAKLSAGFRVQLLTEPSFIHDDAQHTFSIAGVVTDGALLPAPPRLTRRIEFLGDSLTAGYGAGFDLPSPSTVCGGGVLQNDVAMDYSSLLCQAFGAECQWVAWSGITIEAGHPNLPERYEWTLGGQEGAFPYNFTAWAPDAIVMNLGEVSLGVGSAGRRARGACHIHAHPTHIPRTFTHPPSERLQRQRLHNTRRPRRHRGRLCGLCAPPAGRLRRRRGARAHLLPHHCPTREGTERGYSPRRRQAERGGHKSGVPQCNDRPQRGLA